MKWVLVILFLISCNSSSNKKESKYYLIIERSSKSILTNNEEREDKIDSFYTSNDESAFDSAILQLYGMKVADNILRTELKKSNKMDNYPYLGWKILGIKIINESGIDVSTKLSDSVKNKIFEYYDIDPF